VLSAVIVRNKFLEKFKACRSSIKIIVKKVPLWVWGIISLLVFGFVVPLLINWSFTSEVVLIYTAWSAGEFLLYYGTLLGIITMAIIFRLTIVHENEKLRSENQKRDDERKEEEERKRTNFILRSLHFMLSKLNSHTFLGTFTNKIENWENEPHEIYKFFDGASSVININTSFDSEENELIKKEFSQIQQYAQEYTNLLWDFYILLVKQKNLRSMIADRKERQDFIRSVNASLLKEHVNLTDAGFQNWTDEKAEKTKENRERITNNLTIFESIADDIDNDLIEIANIQEKLIKLFDKINLLHNENSEKSSLLVKQIEDKLKVKAKEDK